MKLLIGCPIYKRDWIFPLWASALERQSIPLDEIGFIFETSPDDLNIKNILSAWRNQHPEIPFFEVHERSDIPHFEHQKNSRQWTMSKYYNMVSLRNHILERVREVKPEYYFSLDSDIILKNPATIELLINHIKEGADAVSPLMFMTPVGVDYPSVMTWSEEEDGRAYRRRDYPLGSYFKSDVIMAAKMMSKKAYESIDYAVHSQGEDLGWSLEAKKKGLDLYSASYIYALHVMHEEMLQHLAKSGDSRESILFENHIKI
jgi:hypothetical protein